MKKIRREKYGWKVIGRSKEVGHNVKRTDWQLVGNDGIQRHFII